jgi:acyl dehydratase
MLLRRFSTIGKYKVGDTLKLTRAIRQDELDKFSELTGDQNTLHKDDEAFVHGAFLNGIIAGIIGTHLPGYAVVSQSFLFPNKCLPNEEITFSVKFGEMRKIVTMKYLCEQNGKTVFQGDAKLIAINQK